MSELHLSVIPTDITWQPTAEAATQALAYVRRAFPDPDGVLQEVTADFYDRITAVHAGEALEAITCPRCGCDIPLDWFEDLLDLGDGEFDDLDVTVPCCAAPVTLDTLHYDRPCGFARFELAVADPVRPECEFTAEELATLAGVLGHPVRQIFGHF